MRPFLFVLFLVLSRLERLIPLWTDLFSVSASHVTWLLKSIKIGSSRWNQETPLTAQETPEFHQEGKPNVSPIVKDTPWIAVSDGTCRAPFLPSVSTRQRF